MNQKKYLAIVSACEAYLEKHGDNYLGVGWTKKQQDADTRYRVMLDVIKSHESRIELLDFGCGASHLYEYIIEHRLDHIEYSGLDLSPKFIELSRKKFPAVVYYHLDVLDDERASLPEFDYVLLNGVFNSKCSLSFEDMLEYFQEVIRRAFGRARAGIAFNVMSKQVDWEREDLFHLPFDTLASFLTNHISRHFVMRHDYGLYEYTTYVYRDSTSVPSYPGDLPKTERGGQ